MQALRSMVEVEVEACGAPRRCAAVDVADLLEQVGGDVAGHVVVHEQVAPSRAASTPTTGGSGS